MSLIAAAAQGGVTQVQTLLTAGASVDAADANGRTALMAAAAGGHVGTIKQLLETGASVNATDYAGRTALMVAAEGGHVHIVKLLLEGGASVDAADAEGRTALMKALPGGHKDTIEQLLTAGASVDAADLTGETALIIAASTGYRSSIEQLLEARALVNAVSHAGDTALVIACGWCFFDTVELLIKAGARADVVNAAGETPLGTSRFKNVAPAFLRALVAAQGPSAAAAAVQLELQRGVSSRQLLEAMVAAWTNSTSMQALQQLADALRLLSLIAPPPPVDVISSTRSLVAAAKAGNYSAVQQLLRSHWFPARALMRAADAAAWRGHLAVSLLLVQQLYSGHSWDEGKCLQSMLRAGSDEQLIEAVVQVWRSTVAQQGQGMLSMEQHAHAVLRAVLLRAAQAHHERRTQSSQCSSGNSSSSSKG